MGVLLACVVGVVLRLRAYLFDRSLWLDELFLWSTLGDAELLRAFRPLGEGQVAAPGFVLLAQLSRRILSDSEFALRLLPLVCGIVSLPLFAWLSKRVVGSFGAIAGAWFLALSPHAIYYSADFKPYSLDLLLAIVCLLVTTRLLREGRSPSLRFLALGLVAIFLSLPAALVVGGCGASCFLEALRRRDGRECWRLLCFASAWIALFVVQHQAVLSHHHDNRDLVDYWVRLGAFPSSGVAGHLLFAPRAIFEALSNPGGFGDEWGRVTPTTWGASALFVLGLLVSFRKDARFARMSLAILALVIVAGMLRLYPLSGRVLCFLIPSLVLPVLLALDRLATTGARPVAWCVFALLIVEPSIGAARRAVAPQVREESREVVAALANRIREGDVVYLSWWGRFAWRYYAPQFGLGQVPTVDAAWIQVENVSDYLEDATSKLPRSDRVWFFVTHFYPSDDERRQALNALARGGVAELESIEGPAAAAHRLDLRGLPAR